MIRLREPGSMTQGCDLHLASRLMFHFSNHLIVQLSVLHVQKTHTNATATPLFFVIVLLHGMTGDYKCTPTTIKKE